MWSGGGSALKARAELAAAPGGYNVVVARCDGPGNHSGQDWRGHPQRDPNVCVLVASGYPVDVSVIGSRGLAGRVAFLHKPFAPEMLAAAVGGYLQTEKERHLTWAKEVRAIARERVWPRACRRAIEPKRTRKKPKHKKQAGDERV
jgi:hypothetical protein